MYKFTHAAIVDGFVQALRDNGEIFVLGTKQSDEFGMKLDDSTISLMGKNKEEIVNNLKENSELDLVEGVNTLSLYQMQVDNYERHVGPDRFKLEEGKYPEVTHAMEKDRLIYVLYSSGDIFVLETARNYDGSIKFSDAYGSALKETTKDVKKEIERNSDHVLVRKVKSQPTLVTQVDSWERSARMSRKDENNPSITSGYNLRLLKFDTKLTDYRKTYVEDPFLTTENKMKPNQRSYELSLAKEAYKLVKDNTTVLMLTEDKQRIVRSITNALSSREDLRNAFFKDKVASVSILSAAVEDSEIMRQEVAKNLSNGLKRDSQSLLDFAKEYGMEGEISKKTMAIIKESLSKKKKGKEEEIPVI